MQLVFYGFCGSNSEDAIALDDIFIGPDASLTTTTSMSTEITSEASTQTTNAPSKALKIPLKMKYIPIKANFN